MGQLQRLKKALTEVFNVKQIDLSDLDWIFVHVLNIKRSELSIDKELTQKEIKLIYKLAKARIEGIPLSQCLGEAEFYGLKFIVNKNVLSPRPETELLVEAILKEQQSGRGLDIGTGSGAIAITLNKLGGLNMSALDISSKALKVAKRNARAREAEIEFIKSNLFKNVKSVTYDFIVSNPPYIKTEDIKTLDSEVKDYEPHIALDGGTSGLKYYKEIIEHAPKFLNAGGKIYFELGVGQSKDVKEMLAKDFCDIEIIKDYNNIDRIIKAKKKGD